MSKDSRENDETQTGPAFVQQLRLTVSRGLEPPSSTPISLSSSITTPTSSIGRASITSELETSSSNPNLAKLEGDPLRSSAILPPSWPREAQPPQRKNFPTPMRSNMNAVGESVGVPSYDVQAALWQTNTLDTEVSRGSSHGSFESADLPGATSVNKGDNFGEQRGPRPTKDKLARLIRVGYASKQQEHGIPEEESEARRQAGAANIKRKRSPRSVSLNPRMPKTNSRPGRKYESQWRVGQAPTAGLKESREQTNFDLVLAAVSRFYQGNADSTWKPALRHNVTEYDGKGLTEGIGASIIMAAGLIAAGQASNATHILNRTLPLAEVMLLSQHPQICFWLVDVSMDTSQTVAGHVRRAIKTQFAPLARRLLGPDHPITLLLTTPLTTEQQIRMRREGQVVAHDFHVQTFGIYSYQTMIHQWYWARITASAGRFGEAMGLLQNLTKTWEEVYTTPNSAVVVTALVERARIMVASGDAGVMVECLLADALRRIEVITSTQSLKDPILDAAELRLREGGLIFSQLAALRTLGRVHVMRWNLNAAIWCFKRAVEIAEAGLTETSSVRKLCEADLEATRMMELEQSMGMLSVQDPTSRLPPISSIISLVPIET